MTEDNITSTSTKYPENETATSNSTLAGVGFPGDEVLQLLVPYVALTIFLLILAALSFARFHRTRVAQNRQRLEAIADHLEKEQRISIVMEKECGSPGTVKQIWIIWITWRRNSANLSGSTRLSWWGGREDLERVHQLERTGRPGSWWNKDNKSGPPGEGTANIHRNGERMWII